MSGFLAITLREPDGTEHRLLGWNTVAPSFARAGIPEGDPAAVAQVLASWTRMRADLAENGPEGPFRYLNTDWFGPPGLLAPEEYGLLVIDLTKGVILDGQEGHPLDQVPLHRVLDELEVVDGVVTCPEDAAAHRFAGLYGAGRVRTLYLPTLERKIDLPPDEPEFLFRFLTELRGRIAHDTRLFSWFSLDLTPLRLERFAYRDPAQMRRMRRRVRELGFQPSPAESRRWRAHLAR
jgi:hypothetical protein